jgi:hypothetical protein
MRYEDMHADPYTHLRRAFDCVGVTGISDETIREAVEFARFENMRELELAGTGNRKMLTPGSPDDPESFKTRRGVVGGYRDYLSDELIDYINSRAAQELPQFYGYVFDSARATVVAHD